jgi:hypothetical protein
LRSPAPAYDAESVNLHDWIDELMDALDVETEVDEGLVLDLAREAAHRVQRPAAPISTYLLGYAAALAGGSSEKVEALAARAFDLAARWEGEEELDVEVEVEEIDASELVDAD